MAKDAHPFRRSLTSTPAKLLLGVVLGIGGTILHYERKTLLEVTDADVRQLKAELGTAVYETKYGPIFVGVADPEAEGESHEDH